jgi:hypothetical protein
LNNKNRSSEDAENIEPIILDLMPQNSYIEVYSLAVAWILFEKLIQKNLVRKHNRRVYLATCILISFKLV